MRSGFIKDAPACPRCKKILDGWTATEEAGNTGPAEGDVTVCAYCQAVLQYDGLGLILAPAEVVVEVSYEVSRIQNAIKRYKELSKN